MKAALTLLCLVVVTVTAEVTPPSRQCLLYRNQKIGDYDAVIKRANSADSVTNCEDTCYSLIGMDDHSDTKVAFGDCGDEECKGRREGCKKYEGVWEDISVKGKMCCYYYSFSSKSQVSTV